MHDALRAAAFTARDGKSKVEDKFEVAIGLVRRMLSMGVDPNAADSYGNNALLRALLDSRLRLSGEPGFPDKVANATLSRDLREILQTLIKAGADIHASSPERESAKAFATEPALGLLIQ